MKVYILIFMLFLVSSCSKKNGSGSQPTPVPESFSFSSLKVNGFYNGFTYFNVDSIPIINLGFSAPIDHTSASDNIQLSGIPITITYQNHDSTVIIQPSTSLSPITKYALTVTTSLKSMEGGNLQSPISVSLTTAIDSTDKFSRISDDALLDLVQQQTFKYFWDFADPVSGMARERESNQVAAAMGGTGFGIMTTIAAVNRNFITRSEALMRILKIVNFLTNNCTRYHGAFSHWVNGSTGATIPFAPKDDGADIVETSYMMMGLLTARQFFNSQADVNEIDLRSKINQLWNGVEWTWFQNNQNVLYWNWSPDYGWAVNVQDHGWNETLITYVMAASSPTYPIAKIVYDNGFALNGAIKNGNSYYGYLLPLGPPLGGPLFFEQYSFQGIDPIGLSDAYCDNYLTQTTNHTLINYTYCKTNPNNFNGYSSSCWGLTASDIQNGYNASSPTNDVGVIAPTAALSSFPYTPVQSLNALKFFYYTLGDKIWGTYGFVDAFNLTNIWFDNDYLAIDEGPIICMIENYRSKLLWNLFMSCPEVKIGMTNLGFTSPHF